MNPYAFLPKDWRALLILALCLMTLSFFPGSGYFFFFFNMLGLNALVVLGLNLLIGSTGQVSLGHAAFYGLGAYLSAIASTTWQWPLGAAFLFCLAVVILVSLLVALPTLKLEGHYLVMATLGFNIIVSILLGQLEDITGGPSGFPGIPKLHLGPLDLDSDLNFFYVIWLVFVVFLALTINLIDSRPGRALRAIHEKELTAETLGIPAFRYKVIAFVLSAVYAAIAGFFYAHYVTFISPKTFDIFTSVQIVTMVVVGGMGSIWGGLAGTALLSALPEILHHFEDLHVLLYGLILMGVLIFCPQGLFPTLLNLARSKLFSRFSSKIIPSTDSAGGLKPDHLLEVESVSPNALEIGTFCAADAKTGGLLLSIHGISKSFGGIQALRNVSLGVFSQEIVALIGPNGAGKTTLFNIVSGLIKPEEGKVILDGQNLLGLPPYAIAAHGIGRTFQTVQIYRSFSVLENVLLGFHLQGKSGFGAAYLHTPAERGEERELQKKGLALLEEFRLADRAKRPASEISLLEQKLLELARSLAIGPRVLLLDEPVGGLNPRESELLMGYLSNLRQRGLGMILVEHDMNVVMQMADRIEVLQHGMKIASGTPREIQSNPEVIAAYLGVRKK